MYEHIKSMEDKDKLKVLDDIIRICEREDIKGYGNFGIWIDDYLKYHAKHGIDYYNDYFGDSEDFEDEE